MLREAAVYLLLLFLFLLFYIVSNNVNSWKNTYFINLSLFLFLLLCLVQVLWEKWVRKQVHYFWKNFPLFHTLCLHCTQCWKYFLVVYAQQFLAQPFFQVDRLVLSLFVVDFGLVWSQNVPEILSWVYKIITIVIFVEPCKGCCSH